MKKIFFPIAAIATLLVASCAKEEILEPTGSQVQTKTVLTAGIQTKTVLENDAQVLWTNGDKINVNGVESPALELEEPAATATFEFEGTLEHPYKAVFPASIYKNESTVTLPAYQSYKAGSFAATAAPMAAYATEGSSLSFKNLCSVFKLTINNPGEHGKVAYVDFYGNKGEQVSGDFTLNFENMTLTGASTADADKKLRYKVNHSFADGQLVMYVVVPAADYEAGYTFRILDEAGHYMEQSKATAQTLDAGKVYEATAFDFVPTGTELGVEIATAEDLVKFATDFNAGTIAQTDLKVVTLVQDIVFDAETSAAYATTGGIGVRSGDNAHYFGWVFNGNNKTIKSYTANVPLFAAVDTDGVVKDLTLDNTCAFTFDAEQLDEMGTVVGYHKGMMENVTVNADVTFAAAEVTSAKQIGGICARIREGKVENSVYAGNITVPAGFSATEAKIYVGGIVGWVSNAAGVVSNTNFDGTLNFAGYVASTDKSNPYLMLGGIAGINAGTLSDCEVKGDKKTTIANNTHSYATGTIGNVSTKAYFTVEGGVVGQNEGQVQNCVNRANIINLVKRTGTDGTANDANSRYLYTGGIAGYGKAGEISGCTNYGFIYNRATPRIHKHGGIVGYNNAPVKDCVNETTGTINVATTGDDSYSARLPYVGGVIGQNASDKISNVQNKANISISRIENSQSSEIRAGGVIGSNTAAIDGTSDKNISNSGNVTVENGISNVTLGLFEGGVVGWTSASVKNVKNTGKLTHKNTTSLQKLYLSGVVGAVVATSAVEISGCVNEGEVYFQAATASASGSVEYTNNFLGGVLAYSTSDVTVSDCQNGGYVHGGNSTKLNTKTLYVGGVVGYLMGKSSIVSCVNTGKVYNDHSNNSQDKALSVYAGGVVAFVEGTEANPIAVTNCSVTTADKEAVLFGHRRGYAGGIAGYAEYATLTGCTNDRNFNGSAYYLGGIAGWVVNSSIVNCDWTGTSMISSQLQNAGGIVARLGAGSVVDGCKSYLETLSKGGTIAGLTEVGAVVKNCHYKTVSGLGVCSDANATQENNVADL